LLFRKRHVDYRLIWAIWPNKPFLDWTIDTNLHRPNGSRLMAWLIQLTSG
jgi:hypothetical protein